MRGYVLRMSKPPTRREVLEFAVARMQGAAIVIVPYPCATSDEWLARYAPAGR
jgi:hypothetical protein